MDIYMTDGTLWKGETPITSDSEKREVLMRPDYVSLSWNAPYGDVIPAGSYIDYTYVGGVQGHKAGMIPYGSIGGRHPRIHLFGEQDSIHSQHRHPRRGRLVLA